MIFRFIALLIRLLTDFFEIINYHLSDNYIKCILEKLKLNCVNWN